jgi:hypothetical protein
MGYKVCRCDGAVVVRWAEGADVVSGQKARPQPPAGGASRPGEVLSAERIDRAGRSHPRAMEL